ncbi:hypothetical protein SAMD00023353_0203890 [Rosellinia necatrix]|uniref:Uncharacterized protein n=1 Tax=Rosellinia necatrix TaxID=77044 RepID=A0A1W2TP14_ROSNE|nr:hypothetical protein SAMD00023353_0203890 [Rosellinia necatrix]
MPGPDGVADALNEPEWPFHYPPVVAGVVQNHQVRLSIASHDDLNAMAEFIAEYSWRMKHDAGTLEHVRGVTEEQKWTLLVERYTAGLTAIMDCCVAGSMSGVVLKIQHRGKVQGVMALNLVTPALSDSWSQHELEQSWRSQTCWIYPAAYTDILAELVGGAENRGRTVLSTFCPVYRYQKEKKRKKNKKKEIL